MPGLSRRVACSALAQASIKGLSAIIIEDVNVDGLSPGGYGSLGVLGNLVGCARDPRMLTVAIEGRLDEQHAHDSTSTRMVAFR